MKIAFVIISLIIVLIGVICIFDARKITKKLFSFQDINEGTKALKIFGYVITVLGLGVMYLYMPDAIACLVAV